jgi:predicted permease
MPFLIFSGVVNNLTFNKESLLMMGIVAMVGVAYTFVMFFMSTPLTLMQKDKKTRGMMRFCAVFANNGFLSLINSTPREKFFDFLTKAVFCVIIKSNLYYFVTYRKRH